MAVTLLHTSTDASAHDASSQTLQCLLEQLKVYVAQKRLQAFMDVLQYAL